MDRIEQLRAEQKERESWCDEHYCQCHTPLTEALAIAGQAIASEQTWRLMYNTDHERDHPLIAAQQEQLAEQDRLLERARVLLNNHHTLDPKGVAWLNEADRWLADLKEQA